MSTREAAQAVINGDNVAFMQQMKTVIYDKLSKDDEYIGYMEELDKYADSYEEPEGEGSELKKEEENKE